MNFKQESEAFKTYLKTIGYSKTTTQMLPTCLYDFLNFTQKPTEKITSNDILIYYNHLQQRPNKRRAGGLSESYINHHIYALKLYFNLQETNQLITHNPISNLEFAPPTSKAREILTQAEIKQLYKITQTHQERAVLSLFYGCGLRRNEAEKLNLNDLHFRANLLYVREGKGNKRRAVPMSEKVKTDLKSYILHDRKTDVNQNAFMVNVLGKRMQGNSYNLLLKRLLNNTTIKKEISLHSLRHSIATHLLEHGLPVEYVRDFLGHKHLESTQIYTRINQKQLYEL